MVTLDEAGLFCKAGGFHIDPTRSMKKVETALITHAHSDHARTGARRYFCSGPSVRLLKSRLGSSSAEIVGVPYGEEVRFGKVKVSFHPAGHILGSAQIRMQADSEVWVASGDYKREPDPTCLPFEVLACDTFITEATFGKPSHEWGDSSRTAWQIYEWWQANRKKGLNSLLHCYALGKSQRVLAELTRFTEDRVLLFGETSELTDCYREEGVRMVATKPLESLGAKSRIEGELIIAPSSISRSRWMERLGNHETAFASGWMRTGAFGLALRYDRGFVLSDHADYPALVRTVLETKARRAYVQHAGEGALTRHLRKQGVLAACVSKISTQNDALREQPDLFL